MLRTVYAPMLNGDYTCASPLDETRPVTLRLVHGRQPSEVEAADAAAALTASGFQVDAHDEEGMVITGSHAATAALFHVRLLEAEPAAATEGAALYTHAGPVTLPMFLPYVADILGLHTLPVAKPYVQHAAAAAALASFTPGQLASLYNFPANTGAGATIAIIELGCGYKAADMTAYFRSLGRACSRVVSVCVDGARNNPADQVASLEVVLDMQVAGAAAPGATPVVYFAPNTVLGFYHAIQAAIHSRAYPPTALSISWGAAERYWSTPTMQSYNALFAGAVAKGINVFVAAGDGGAADGAPGLNADFPASSPNVVACGGTRLTATATSIQSETVWNNGASVATGGGFSAVFF